MPALGSDMDEGTLNEWLVKPGDSITRGQVVAVVETTKAAVEVECWQEGTVAELLVPIGQTVQVGTPLARLVAPGESVESTPPPAAATVAESAPSTPPVEPIPEPVTPMAPAPLPTAVLRTSAPLGVSRSTSARRIAGRRHRSRDRHRPARGRHHQRRRARRSPH